MPRRVRNAFATQLEVATPELISVIGGAVLVMAGFGLIIPALPLFAKGFGVGDLEVSYLVTGFAVMRLLGNGFAGRVLKRRGERATTVAGAVIVGVSSLAAGMAPGFWWLFAFRVSGGIGSAFYFAGLLSFLLARVAPHQRGRAMSLFQGAVAAGILAGPLLGGVLIAFSSENVPFFVYGVACLAGATWSYRTMSVPVAQHGLAASRPSMDVLKELFKDRAYVFSLIVAMTGFIVVSAPQVLAPSLWIGALGKSKATIGIPFAVMTAAGVAVMAHAGPLVDRRGRRVAMIGGSFALAGGLAFISGSATAMMFVLGLAIVGAATGYTRPAASSVLADVSSEDQRTTAMGGFRIAQDLGAVLGAALAGPLSKAYGPRFAFGGLAVVALIAAMSTLTLRETAPHLVRDPEIAA